MGNRNTKANVFDAPVILSIPVDISKNYLLTRSDIFYFIKVINYETEIFKTRSNLTSKPNIIFYSEDAVDKVILDYSNANDTDKWYLKSLFSGMNQNTGFTLSSGSYLEEAKQIVADLSSNITFKEYNNNYLFGVLNSVNDKNIVSDVYSALYFTDTPQIFSSSSYRNDQLTKKTALINPMVGTNFLKKLGISVGDYVQIINSKSLNKDIYFRVEKYIQINNFEILVIDGSPVSENLTGQPTIINIFQETKNKTSIPLDIQDTVFGICNVSPVMIQNSTKYQCQLRGGTWIKYT